MLNVTSQDQVTVLVPERVWWAPPVTGSAEAVQVFVPRTVKARVLRKRVG